MRKYLRLAGFYDFGIYSGMTITQKLLSYWMFSSLVKIVFGFCLLSPSLVIPEYYVQFIIFPVPLFWGILLTTLGSLQIVSFLNNRAFTFNITTYISFFISFYMASIISYAHAITNSARLLFVFLVLMMSMKLLAMIMYRFQNVKQKINFKNLIARLKNRSRR